MSLWLVLKERIELMSGTQKAKAPVPEETVVTKTYYHTDPQLVYHGEDCPTRLEILKKMGYDI